MMVTRASSDDAFREAGELANREGEHSNEAIARRMPTEALEFDVADPDQPENWRIVARGELQRRQDERWWT